MNFQAVGRWKFRHGVPFQVASKAILIRDPGRLGMQDHASVPSRSGHHHLVLKRSFGHSKGTRGRALPSQGLSRNGMNLPMTLKRSCQRRGVRMMGD